MNFSQFQRFTFSLIRETQVSLNSMISVCMATYNGALFVSEQIDSILTQLREEDELIISDDGSTDDTIKIIESYDDPRIHLFRHSSQNIVGNFENALSKAHGEIIFLADQDDVWLPDKVKTCLTALSEPDTFLVVSDCSLIDSQGREIHPSYFALRNPQPTFLGNLYKNSFVGCCMAFKRPVLERALPFPPALPMHDSWIGMTALGIGKVAWIDQPLIKYRRHSDVASGTGGHSQRALSTRLKDRWFLLYHSISRRFRS